MPKTAPLGATSGVSMQDAAVQCLRVHFESKYMDVSWVGSGGLNRDVSSFSRLQWRSDIHGGSWQRVRSGGLHCPLSGPLQGKVHWSKGPLPSAFCAWRNFQHSVRPGLTLLGMVRSCREALRFVLTEAFQLDHCVPILVFSWLAALRLLSHDHLFQALYCLVLTILT